MKVAQVCVTYGRYEGLNTAAAQSGERHFGSIKVLRPSCPAVTDAPHDPRHLSARRLRRRLIPDRYAEIENMGIHALGHVGPRQGTDSRQNDGARDVAG